MNEASESTAGEGLSEAERRDLVQAREHDLLNHPHAVVCTEALIEHIVAARVSAARREAAREALNEAADDAYWYDDTGAPNRDADWLRDRAARIGGDS